MDVDSCAAQRAGFDAQVTPVEQDDLMYHREANAMPGGSRIGTLAAVQYLFAYLGWNAGAIIFNGDFYLIGIQNFCMYTNDTM